MNFTPEMFVAAWQKTGSLDDVVRALGVERQAASNRATRLRKAGVPLKRFRPVGAKLSPERLESLKRIARGS